MLSPNSLPFFSKKGVARVLGRPNTVLMGESKAKVLPWLFWLYFRPLQEETRRRVREQAEKQGFFGSGEALFYHARAAGRRIEGLHARLDEFRNLYGFCRNVSFTLLVVALVLAIARAGQCDSSSYWWTIGAAIVGLTMFYRYLKFFRQYSQELFTSYAEMKEEAS